MPNFFFFFFHTTFSTWFSSSLLFLLLLLIRPDVTVLVAAADDDHHRTTIFGWDWEKNVGGEENRRGMSLNRVLIKSEQIPNFLPQSTQSNNHNEGRQQPAAATATANKRRIQWKFAIAVAGPGCSDERTGALSAGTHAHDQLQQQVFILVQSPFSFAVVVVF